MKSIHTKWPGNEIEILQSGLTAFESIRRVLRWLAIRLLNSYLYRAYLVILVMSMVFRNTQTFGTGIKPFEIVQLMGLPAVMILFCGGKLSKSTRLLLTLFVTFFTLNFISNLVSIQYISSEENFAYYFRLLSISLLSILLSESISINLTLIHSVSLGFLIGGIVSIIWMVLFPSYDFIGTYRIQGAFDDPNFMAFYLIVCINISTHYGLHSRSMLKSAAYFLIVAGFVAALLLTYSRSGWIATTFSLLTLCFVTYRTRWKNTLIKKGAITSYLVVWALLITIVFFPDFTGRIVGRFIPKSGNTVESLASDRPTLWLKGMDSILQSPLGYGMGQMTEMFRVQNISERFLIGHSPQVHNIFLQIGGDFGWLGLLMYFGLIVITTATGVSILRNPNTLNSAGTMLLLPLTTSYLGLLLFSLFFSMLYAKELWLLSTVMLAFRYYSQESRIHLHERY